jgi:hypothetical protein
MLYQSESGLDFLSKLNQDHINVITPYINPELWAIKFKKDGNVSSIKELLKVGGY